MEKEQKNVPELFKALTDKGSLKQYVYSTTFNMFKQFQILAKKLVNEYQVWAQDNPKKVIFEYKDKGEFEFELRFAGDVLIFLMHTNVFEIPRDHEVMKTSYIKGDKTRSYCGVINIYNFLSDSFKYDREEDVGYLIGRIFINKEKHYFIEGKREIGLLFNNFPNATIDKENIRSIIESAIMYTINFDLLTPPYDTVKEMSVTAVKDALNNMNIRTGKRLGFKFNADNKLNTNVRL